MRSSGRLECVTKEKDVPGHTDYSHCNDIFRRTACEALNSWNPTFGLLMQRQGHWLLVNTYVSSLEYRTVFLRAIAPSGPGPSLSQSFYITHKDAPQSFILLWTSDWHRTPLGSVNFSDVLLTEKYSRHTIRIFLYSLRTELISQLSWWDSLIHRHVHKSFGILLTCASICSYSLLFSSILVSSILKELKQIKSAGILPTCKI